MPSPHTPSPRTQPSSVSEEEIARFSALAERWWDPHGPMRPLHAMNPLRTGWIHRHAAAALGPSSEPLRLLDIGCGAGLASEAFAALGFDTLGLDASESAIAAAKAHLADCPLPPQAAPLQYRAGSAEDLVREGATFDVISALEVIEHVNDPQNFLDLLAALTRPGGVIALSTLNRTVRSLLVAKFGAEYVLRMLPIGTHDWRKFVKPEELDEMARASGLRMIDMAGLRYLPPRWHESRDSSINYIAIFAKR